MSLCSRLRAVSHTTHLAYLCTLPLPWSSREEFPTSASVYVHTPRGRGARLVARGTTGAASRPTAVITLCYFGRSTAPT